VPILRRFGFTATVYVLAERLGGDNGWDAEGPRKALMTAEQVRQVAEAGWDRLTRPAARVAARTGPRATAPGAARESSGVG